MGLNPASAQPHDSYIGSSSICPTCHKMHEAKARWQQERVNSMVGRTEDDDTSSVTITGTWETSASPYLSGGTSLESSQTNASATFAFWGKNVAWIGSKSPGSGIARVFLDNQFQDYANLYSAVAKDQATVYKSPTNLDETTHTLLIEVAGTKDASSTGYTVSVDGFDIRPSKDSLLNQPDEKAVCYTCHNGTGSSTDTAQQFGDDLDGGSTKKSYHPVPGGTLVCSDCHTAHKKPENNDGIHEAHEVIKLLRAIFKTFFGFVVSPLSTWTDIPAKPNLGLPPQKKLAKSNDYCAACHGINARLPGGDKVTYFNNSLHDTSVSGPPSGSGIKCLACHASHGSDLDFLLESTISGNAVTDTVPNSVCYACHQPGTPIYDYWTTTSPSGDYHGNLDSTSTSPTLKPPFTRPWSLNCEDCHDPHGTPNVRMIKESVNTTMGISITTDTDDVGVRQLCDACHQNYTDDQPNCLSCHFHGANADMETSTTF